MQLNPFIRDHEERFVFRIVETWDAQWTVQNKSRLAPLIVDTGCSRAARRVLVGDTLMGVRIHICIPKHIVCRAVVLIRSASQNRIRYRAIAVTIL